jgi:MscS family membrane protein
MERLMALMTHELGGIPVWTYLTALGAIVAGFVAKQISDAIFRRLLALTAKTKLPFDEILVGALSRPFGWALQAAGIYVALVLLPVPEEPLDLRRLVDAALVAYSTVLLVWVATRFVDGISDWWEARARRTESRLDDQLIPIVRRSLKVFCYVIGAVLALQNLGYSVGSLLAGLGIGGLAIAMASKDTVANLFGSLVIFLDKPFQIGDWIELGDLEGTVEEVGLRTTRVRTFANSLITLPNSQFTTQPVNNWSKMKKRRIMMTVGVTYDTTPEQLDELVRRIRDLIAADEKLHDDFYLVNFDSFGPSSLDIFIYCFTVTTNWGEFLQAKQEFMLRLMALVDELGLSFAFPTQTVHLEAPAGAPTALSGQRPR